jgi:hypothetical protein
MYKTVVAVVLRRKAGSDAGRYVNTRRLDEMITSIINSRLNKLEGLRGYLRRYCCALGLASGNSMSVMYLDPKQVNILIVFVCGIVHVESFLSNILLVTTNCFATRCRCHHNQPLNR